MERVPDRQLSRRRALTLLAGTGAVAALAPACSNAGGAGNVDRNRTLVLGITGNRLTDYRTFNPFLPGISTSTGYPFCFEALFYYNSYYTDKVCGPPGLDCKDGEIPWLGESYEYNSDFTELTFHLRKGPTWQDGKPFTANDVVFTIKMLKDNAPKLTWSIDMQQWVKDISAPDDRTVHIVLNKPNPRFAFSYFIYHQDIGIPLVPEHIWKGKDPNKFTFLDVDKNWPVTTSPWQIVNSSPQQRIFHRDDNWWGKKVGFTDLPGPQAITVIPGSGEDQMVQLAISNRADETIDLRPNNIKAVLQRNKQITTWTHGKPPYGYRDWWPVSLGFNDMREPYSDPEIRWAINHAINRDQIVELGYNGAGEKTLLPYPNFPALQEYLDGVSDLAAKIDDFDLDKTAQIMQKKGYTKDSKGIWTKDGKRFSMLIYSSTLFQDFTPVLVTQLRKGGFDANFKIPVGTDFDEHVSTGNVDAYLNGHGGSVRDPYFTLRLYESRYTAPTGKRATYSYRWVNKKFDSIVDEMGSIGSDDPRLHKLFREAMQIWIPELPDIGIVQWYHRIPTDTTYWKNWPSESNPYINTAYWHRTSPLWIHSIKPVQ